MTEPAVPLEHRVTVDEAEAAALLGIGERTLRRLREHGLVPVIDFGEIDGKRVDLVRYSPVTLARWADERSGYPSAGGQDGEEANSHAVRSGQRVPRTAGAVGRGRPRGGAVAQTPVRLIRGGSGG